MPPLFYVAALGSGLAVSWAEDATMSVLWLLLIALVRWLLRRRLAP
ncbi:hypothetical protein [Pseudonocardia sp. T1-2H]